MLTLALKTKLINITIRIKILILMVFYFNKKDQKIEMLKSKINSNRRTIKDYLSIVKDAALDDDFIPLTIDNHYLEPTHHPQEEWISKFKSITQLIESRMIQNQEIYSYLMKKFFFQIVPQIKDPFLRESFHIKTSVSSGADEHEIESILEIYTPEFTNSISLKNYREFLSCFGRKHCFFWEGYDLTIYAFEENQLKGCRLLRLDPGDKSRLFIAANTNSGFYIKRNENSENIYFYSNTVNEACIATSFIAFFNLELFRNAAHLIGITEDKWEQLH